MLASLEPIIIGVAPPSSITSGRVSLRVAGVNFRSGADVFLVRGATSIGLDGVAVRDSATIEGQVPAGLPLGTYDVLVVNQDGSQARLPGGYTVTSLAPVLRLVLPSQGSQDIPVDLVLLGANFADGITGRLEGTAGTQPLGTVRVASGTSARAVVPSGLPAGTYAVVLAGAGGEGRLADAFTVLAPTGGGLDMSLTGGDLWTDGAARSGGTVRLGANLTRRGGTGSVSVPVSFYLGDPAAGGALIGATTSAPIGLGSEPEPVAVTWSLGAVQGSQVVYAVLDPANTLGESNRANNSAARTVTILPPASDTTPPTLSSLSVAGGAATTSSRSVAVALGATDNAGGSGLASMLIIERELSAGARAWIAIGDPIWQPYAATRTYELTDTPGVHYLQAWVADGAGNISAEVVRAAINYEPAQDSLLRNQRRLYRRTLVVGETLTASVSPVTGDPDLYVWGPSGERLAMSNAAGTATEQASVTAAVAGVYQVEVYAYSDTTYSLTLRVGSGSTAARRGLAVDPGKTALTAPLVSATDAPAGQTALPPAPVSATQIAPTPTPTPTATPKPPRLFLPYLANPLKTGSRG